MSLIDGLIPAQGFEVIRDRICQILAVELEQQFLLSGDYDLEDIGDKIYMERMVPFDHTECPAINVRIERGDYNNQHQGAADGIYRYFIEHNVVALTEDGLRGDTSAKVKAHKIMGKVRAIFENPVYKTLAFPAPFIAHRHIESFVFSEPTRNDAENSTMAQMVLVVRCLENTALLDSTLILGYDTTVKLYDTDKGYYWSKQD